MRLAKKNLEKNMKLTEVGLEIPVISIEIPMISHGDEHHLEPGAPAPEQTMSSPPEVVGCMGWMGWGGWLLVGFQRKTIGKL